ncbi:Protein RecA [Candidatus Entotheonellaceae bacterium PAL068K]
MPGKTDTDKAIEQACAYVEHQFGRGSLMRLGAAAICTDIAPISTGSMALDAALGIGGIPRGCIAEIFGPTASGKTTLALHSIAAAQQTGGIAAFIDAEHALDAVYAGLLGVDTDTLLVSQPDTGEQALDIVDILVRSGALDIIVIDSVAALVPKAELDGGMGDAPMGRQARLMSQGLRKLTAMVNKSRASIIFINQLRHKLGVQFGNPEATTGGDALKFVASVRLDVRPIKALKCRGIITGSRTRVRVVKNKLAPPFRQAEFDIVSGEGISRTGEILDLAVVQGLIVKHGTWFTYQDTRLGQGRGKAKAFLQNVAETATALETQLRLNLGLSVNGITNKNHHHELH